MKHRFGQYIFLKGIVLAAGITMSAAWSRQVNSVLAGLGPAFPRDRETEITFIRNRVIHPLVAPEWIAGTELEERWLYYEKAARFFLGMTASVVLVFLPTLVTCRRNTQDP